MMNRVNTRCTLRELTSSDQDFLWEMEYMALWDPPSEPRRPKSVLGHPSICRLVENWGRNEDFGLVAIDSRAGQSVGAIWARLDGYDKLEGYGCPYPALGIAVLPEVRRTGVGSHLLNEFITALRDRVDGLRLGVHAQNAHARKFYEKHGFIKYAKGAGNYSQMKLDFA